jgi:hypothetical protein
MAGEKKRKAELKLPASGAEDSYDDDEDEESEEEVEVCDQTVEERPARPVEGARAKFGSIVGPREPPPPNPDKRMESRRETYTASRSQADNAPDSR